MSDEIIEESFRVAHRKIQEAHEAALSDVQAKVEKAKEEALRKLRA